MDNPVDELIADVSDDQRREDSRELTDILAAVTGQEPKVWGEHTIGFGQYHYKYTSGREGDFFQIGFAPRKTNLTLYVMSGLRGFEDILARIGRHRSTKSTVQFSTLADIDVGVLKELAAECVRHLQLVEDTLGAIPRMSDIPPRTPKT